jgi:hypothetical protein
MQAKNTINLGYPRNISGFRKQDIDIMLEINNLLKQSSKHLTPA